VMGLKSTNVLVELSLEKGVKIKESTQERRKDVMLTNKRVIILL